MKNVFQLKISCNKDFFYFYLAISFQLFIISDIDNGNINYFQKQNESIGKTQLIEYLETYGIIFNFFVSMRS